MSHDPLCPELWRWDDGQPCMFCALITRIREDESDTWDEAYARGFNDGRVHGSKIGYAAALRDVTKAIAAIPKEDGGYCHVLHACDVEASIEDLCHNRTENGTHLTQCDHLGGLDIWEDGIPHCHTCGLDMSNEYEMGN